MAECAIPATVGVDAIVIAKPLVLKDSSADCTRLLARIGEQNGRDVGTRHKKRRTQGAILGKEHVDEVSPKVNGEARMARYSYKNVLPPTSAISSTKKSVFEKVLDLGDIYRQVILRFNRNLQTT